MKKIVLILCALYMLGSFANGSSVKGKKPADKFKFNSYPEECREDLNDCLDHSWAHLPDSPPIGYCCEHYNYCLYGP